MSEAGEAQGIRVAAMNLLARREYSRAELAGKLARRFKDAAEIERQLDRLRQEGLQSDQRFLRNFVQARAARGHGPNRISRDLGGFGFSKDDLRTIYDELQIDWREMALDVLLRKYRQGALESDRERNRAHQFLYRRGFTTDDLIWAVKAFGAGNESG